MIFLQEILVCIFCSLSSKIIDYCGIISFLWLIKYMVIWLSWHFSLYRICLIGSVQLLLWHIKCLVI